MLLNNEDVFVARRGGGLRTAIKIVKAIDRANKNAARESERKRKTLSREKERALREQQRVNKHKQREAKKTERLSVLEEKKAFKTSMSDAQQEYLERCKERSELRKKYIQKELK